MNREKICALSISFSDAAQIVHRDCERFPFSAGESSLRRFQAARSDCADRGRAWRLRCRSCQPPRDRTVLCLRRSRTVRARFVERISRARSTGMAKSSRDSARYSLPRHGNAARRQETARARLSSTIGSCDATPGENWQLHRFLFLLSSCPQCRDDVARPGKRAHAELEMAAGGVSRSRELARYQRNRRAPAKGTNQTAGGGHPHFQSDQEYGLRIGNGVFDWTGQFVRRASADRSSRRARFRFRFNERLERARYSGLGISAARPVSGEKFLHKHFAVGRHDGSFGTISETVVETRSRAAAISPREK